jgi:DNA-binding transcriptional ArsR family regulator
MNNFTYELLFIRVGGCDNLKKGLTGLCHRFFTNLSNPTRLAALEKLAEKPMSVNELADALSQEQSMVSHNLKPLLKCNFIYAQRQGKKHIYSVNQETITALFAVIENHAKKFCPTGGKCILEGEIQNAS